MIFLLVYLVIAALCVLPASRIVLMSMSEGLSPEPEDIVLAIAVGLCVAWLWPLALMGVPFYLMLRTPVPPTVDLEKR